MRRMKIFLRSVVLPVTLAVLLAMLFRPVYYKDNQLNILLMWICIGVPYGIRRMFLWLVPHKYDLAGKCRKTVPEDIEDVMMNTESGNMARIALRMTKAGIAKEDDWKEFIRQLERKKLEEQKE